MTIFPRLTSAEPFVQANLDIGYAKAELEDSVKTIQVTIDIHEVTRVLIEHAKGPLYMRSPWSAEVTNRDAWGDWTITFTEPEPEAEKPA